MDNDTAVRYTKCKGGEAMREKKDINIEIGGNIQVAREQAVSYTHLDVYKRQEYPNRQGDDRCLFASHSNEDLEAHS